MSIDKKLNLIIMLCFVLLGALSLEAQNRQRFSLTSGAGVFANIEDLGVDIAEGNNPRMAGMHYGVATFVEFLYLLPSNYWLGFKYMDCDLSYPNNDHGKIFWETNQMISFDSYSIVLKKSYSKGKSFFDFSGGPLLHDYNRTQFNYDEYQTLDVNGDKIYAVLNPNVYFSHFIDIGMFLAFEYKYNVLEHLNVGIKAEAYGLLYIGKQAVVVTPVIEIRL
ncbi:MAG: hypothetical protein JXC36_05970 [Candidatus Atribacteria bacterium]|nr:hypothetical protein [Candidatus Atribacteria bacterium]